jgi:hypothetical protein
MQAQRNIGKTVLRTAFVTVLALAVLSGAPAARAGLTLGHQVLLEKGLQIKALVGYPSVDIGQYNSCNFTSIDLGYWYSTWNYDAWAAAGLLPTGANALDFSHWFESNAYANFKVCSNTYLPHLVSIQLADEQSIVNTTAYPNQLSAMATAVAAIKANHPGAMVYTNQSVLYHEDPGGTYNITLTPAILNTYIQTVKPDMLHFTEYPFRFQGAGTSHDYKGGSPKEMYQHLELYRKAGLAGLDGTGAKPIPVGMFAQTFSDGRAGCNNRQPTESEFRLQQFAGWASGMKWINAYQYVDFGQTNFDAMFFAGTASSGRTPTAKFYQYAELNRQSANLGDALVRLISTNFSMKMGQYKSGTATYTNPLPSGVSAWSATADPYLKDVVATNLGTTNDGRVGDVVLGYFKPLDASLVPAGCENDAYFMIVNGLSSGTASLAAACSQRIDLTFDFGTSGVSSLLRLSRDTGLVEEVALTSLGGSRYGLSLTLDGGTGDLFKYNTGSAFVPEPGTSAFLAAGLLAFTVYAWRRRR